MDGQGGRGRPVSRNHKTSRVHDHVTFTWLRDTVQTKIRDRGRSMRLGNKCKVELEMSGNRRGSGAHILGDVHSVLVRL